MEKGEIAQNEQFHLFPQCFLCNLYLKFPLIATFHLSSAAALNLGWSQNCVLGNGLKAFANATLNVAKTSPSFYVSAV